MDESWWLDAWRFDAAALFCSVRAILSEILAGLCRGRRAGAGGHGAERDGHRSGWPHARLQLAAGIRDWIRQEPSRSIAAEKWPHHQDLDSRSQLQPLGPRYLRTRRS